MADADHRQARKTQNDPLTDSSTDILAAAQQLKQLKDEDNDNDDTDVDVDVVVAGASKRKRSSSSEQEVDQIQSLRETTSAKIKEIFGKDTEEVVSLDRPKKQRKYRSLVNIYRMTKPISDGNGTKVKA